MAGEPYRRLLERLEATRTLGVSFGLERMARALEKLGSPERQVTAVHVAGTNGKGSTVAMLEAILQAAGRTTGLFTSPHLCRFTERIRLHGVEIDSDVLAALGERVLATQVPLTYFEVATALGFLAMAEAKVEFGIFEVGLGGRLDATNLCQPIATAITSIGLDHQELLGDTLGAIAAEKAGIAKPGVPLYVGPVAPEAAEAIAAVARAVGAPLLSPDKDVAVPGRLGGAHQVANARLAVSLARRVAAAGGFTLDAGTIARGLEEARWPGRLEEVTPGLWLDAAHNPDGARALAAALPPGQPRVLVVSIVRGKAAAEILATLGPHFDRIIVTRSSSARALPAAELAHLLPPGLTASVIDEPAAALGEARRAVAAAVGGSGVVVVAGSIFLVGQVRALVTGEPVDPVLTGDPLP